MVKKKYYLNPIVGDWIGEAQLNYYEFAELAGVCVASVSEALNQSKTPGVIVRRGILAGLAKTGHQGVNPEEIFSTEKYII